MLRDNNQQVFKIMKEVRQYLDSFQIWPRLQMQKPKCQENVKEEGNGRSRNMRECEVLTRICATLCWPTLSSDNDVQRGQIFYFLEKPKL